MPRKKQTVKKNKKGKGILKVVNVDGTVSIVDKKTGIRKTIALSSNKNDNKKQINNFKNNSPKKTRKIIKNFFKKFRFLRKKSKKLNKEAPALKRQESSFDRTMRHYQNILLTQK